MPFATIATALGCVHQGKGPVSVPVWPRLGSCMWPWSWPPLEVLVYVWLLLEGSETVCVGGTVGAGS